jgi:hypothetical protein
LLVPLLPRYKLPFGGRLGFWWSCGFGHDGCVMGNRTLLREQDMVVRKLGWGPRLAYPGLRGRVKCDVESRDQPWGRAVPTAGPFRSWYFKVHTHVLDTFSTLASRAGMGHDALLKLEILAVQVRRLVEQSGRR